MDFESLRDEIKKHIEDHESVWSDEQLAMWVNEVEHGGKMSPETKALIESCHDEVFRQIVEERDYGL